MKNLYKALASAAIVLLAASCVNEMGNDTTDGLFRKYNLSFEGSTKTELSGTCSTRQVKWTDGDEIKYYTKDKQSSASTASVSADGSTAWVEIPRGRNDDFINAVYGAGSLNASSSTSDCIYVESPAKDSQSYTTFAQAHLCAAFSSDLEDPNLRFHNAVAVLKITSAASISKVVFSGNKGEVITGGSNGSLKLTYSGGAVSAEPSSTGGTSVTVQTGGAESDFYIAILPVNFSGGISVRGYDASGYLLCERRTSGALNTVNAAGLPVIANLGSIQDWLDNPKPTPVDLGLSVKWASFNLGAKTPEGSGDYFSWGETAPKSSYSWSTYAYGQSKTGPFSEYVLDPSFGTVDYKTVLDLEDDAAHAIWGDAWRIPSKEEIQELRDNCIWTWTTINGVNGYKVSSSITGNSIFLPAVGIMSGSKVQNAGTEGDYWSSSLYTAESCSSWSPYFTSSAFSTGDCYRYFGLPVRPVYGEVVPVAEITLSSTSMDLLIGQTGQLTATVLPNNATYKGLIWTSSDESVATVDVTGKVTAVSIGTVSIAAHSADAKKSAVCEVTVLQKAESITLDKTSLEIYVGDEPVALVATVQPDTYTSKDFTWSSSNKSIATVDDEGKVTAVTNGTATITVKTSDGSGLSATCSVKVYRHVESVSLNKTEMTLYVAGNSSTLTATVLPSTSNNKNVTWTSSDESVATVDQSGKVTAVGLGKSFITVTTVDGAKTASCEVTVKEAYGYENGYEYVDLGLPSGLKWATMNVGATKPEGYGAYFAWGETEPKSNYSWSTYKWCNVSYNNVSNNYDKKITKYNTQSSYGTVDYKTVLAPGDDAAHVNWGGSWRMPTAKECDELINNCTWTWTTQNGVKGRLVTGPNGKSIFLPAAGYRDGRYLEDAGTKGDYWSSSLSNAYYAHSVNASSGSVYRYNGPRDQGKSVRPVSE